MKNFGIDQVGIQKYQTGTVKGGLQPQNYSGSWGDRGQGNELQSAFENGLSWIGDKVMNAGDYIDKGINKGIELVFGKAKPTEKELIAQYLKENSNVTLVDKHGNEVKYHSRPVVNTGMAPLPGVKDWGSLYQQIAAKTKIVAESADKIYKYRRATDSADRFLAGKNVTQALENSKDFVGYSAHGMSKGTDTDMLATLRTILRYGTDPKRTFYTAPTSKMDSRLHAAMGTSSGHAYSDGPFMLLTKDPLNTTRPGAFTHVLINDGMGDEALELANKYKQVIQKEFPDIKALLYSEVK